MTDKQRMIAGMLYKAQGEEISKDYKSCRTLTRQFNNSTEEQMEYRLQMLKELFGATGEKLFIEPPFRCDYGYNISIGESFYANYDCIIIDVCKVQIGANVFFGPRVSIYTAAHPIDAAVRNEYLEFGRPVTIGDNVWVGGNTVINPGVTIGNNVVIGSGSVVTKDIPDDVIAVGNPCKILRRITDADRVYWEKEKATYFVEES